MFLGGWIQRGPAAGQPRLPHLDRRSGQRAVARRCWSGCDLQSPVMPIVANVTGEFYPTGPDVVPQMLDMLAQQVASPVQFVKGLRTLYEAGARVFVEVGPKKALQGFAEDVLGSRGDVVSLFTNHPKFGDIVAFNQALCGLYAAGLGSRSLPIAVRRNAGSNLDNSLSPNRRRTLKAIDRRESL